MKKDSQKRSLYNNSSLGNWINPDRIFLRLLTKNRKNMLIRLAIFFTKLGNGQLWLVFSFTVMIYSVPLGVAFQAAVLIQLYAQIALKNFFKRARPYQFFEDLEILYHPPDPYSFPSGHTCAAFTMVFVSQFILPIMWPFFLVLALGIAFSRIYLAAHYPTDVFAGVLIAYFSAKLSIMFSELVTGIVL